MRASPAARLVVSHCLAATAMSMPWPPLLSAVWETTGSDVQVAAAGALRMLPYVALSAFGGMLADRLRRSTVLRWSTAVRTALLACCAVALATDHVGWAVAFGTLTVAVGTPCYPAAVSSMPELAGPLSPRLTSLLVTAEVTAFVAGPALGGVLIGMGSGSWATAGSATICLLGALLLAGVRTGTVVPATGRADHGRLRAVLRCPGVPHAIAAVVVVNFVLSAASIGLVTLSYESWGSGDRGYGIAAAALGFGSLAALFLAPVLRFRGSLLASGSGSPWPASLPELPLPLRRWRSPERPPRWWSASAPTSSSVRYRITCVRSPSG